MTAQFLSRWYAFAVLLCVTVLPGCAAVKATEQPPKRNLAVLDKGVPRTHVIAELGAPTWSDERENETTDVFTFKQGYKKETKAARALAHGAADVATFGLWEVVGIPFETIADGTEVQVEVHYGDDQKVSSVTVIKGDHVVNPPPNLLARFGGKHTRPKAAAVAASRVNTAAQGNLPARNGAPAQRGNFSHPLASDAFDEDAGEVSTANAETVINDDTSFE